MNLNATGTPDTARTDSQRLDYAEAERRSIAAECNARQTRIDRDKLIRHAVDLAELEAHEKSLGYYTKFCRLGKAAGISTEPWGTDIDYAVYVDTLLTQIRAELSSHAR